MISDTLQDVGQALHDVGLAAWLGGSMFGKFAHNPSLRNVTSRPERGKTANAAWNGYNLINTASLAAISVVYGAARATELNNDNLTDRERTLATVMDGLTAAAVVTGIANGVQGARLAARGPDGAVPVETGTVPSAETPAAAARIQRSLGVLGTVNIAIGIGLVATNAIFRRSAFTRPSTRRALTRSSTPGQSGPSSLVLGSGVGALAAAINEARRRNLI